MKIIKKNIKLIIGIIIGLIISGISVYAVTVASSDVTYSNSKTTAKNVNAALNDLYSRVGDVSSVNTPVILDTSRFNSDTFNALAFSYLYAKGGSLQEGYCTQTKINMDLVDKITVEKFQHFTTYAPIAYIAFFDEYTDDYNTIVNNATSSIAWSDNTSGNWVQTTVNWVIDTSSIHGYKYISMAYVQRSVGYENHMIYPGNVTIN